MAVGSVNRKIHILGDMIVLDEDKAAVALTPGYLVDYDANGYKLNATTNRTVGRTFVLERDEMGNGIDIAYAINDQVKVGAFGVGQRVLAVIPSGQNIAKGALLTPDGFGRLTAASSNPAIAKAVEAVNNTNGDGNSPIASNGNGKDARIIVEIL